MMDLASFTYEKLHAENPEKDLENTILNMRIWISSGKGDFNINSNVFYLFIFHLIFIYLKIG